MLFEAPIRSGILKQERAVRSARLGANASLHGLLGVTLNIRATIGVTTTVYKTVKNTVDITDQVVQTLPSYADWHIGSANAGNASNRIQSAIKAESAYPGRISKGFFAFENSIIDCQNTGNCDLGHHRNPWCSNSGQNGKMDPFCRISHRCYHQDTFLIRQLGDSPHLGQN